MTKKNCVKCSQDVQNGLLKSKIKKCSQESKRNRRKMNIKSREEKLVCKGI